MKAEPRVSIVINNFNYARFLGDAIDSALAQTYENVEVIVVDDGSTDASRDVMAGYGERIIPVLKDNGGQGSAYNAGYASSTGDIVCFLDSDDTLLPETIDACIEGFRDDAVVRVQWSLHVTDAAGHRSSQTTTVEPPPDGRLLERVVRDGPLYDFNYHTNCAHHRGFLERVMPVPEAPYRHGADVYLTTLAAAYGVVETLSNPYGTYRVHGDNNYAERALDDERLQDYVRRFEMNAAVLAEHLGRLGWDVRPDDWKASAFNYLWPTRLLATRKSVRDHLPDGMPFILIDGVEWGSPASVDRRCAVRIERDGDYWGDPPDDATAIAEVKRLARDGLRYVVIWWTKLWWLRAYPNFMLWMDERSDRMPDVPTDAAVIFRLHDDAVGAAYA